MKKILGLVGSQRKLANGEILIKEAAAACGVEYSLELLRLPELRIDPCRGCYACLVPDKLCPIGDDLYFLVEKIKEADGVIVAAPCYALGPAAIIKLVGDRIIALAQLLDDFWGKPCVVIGTTGIEGWEGYTLSALTTTMQFMGLDVKDSHMFVGALPGEALQEEASVSRVRRLGTALFGDTKGVEEGQCPTCRSDIWKFPTPGTARCPFCGQEASLHAGDTGIEWEFKAPGSRFEREHLREHFQVWLKGMVQEFVSRRKELALIRNRYKANDVWVRPKF
jgi:multimeric flavodoxin WrbA